MRHFLGIFAVLLVLGVVAVRVVGWGTDVADYVETEHQSELVALSNSVVNPLIEVTESVDGMHALFRQAIDTQDENHRGTVLLIGMSKGVLSESITNARASLAAVDMAERNGMHELLKEAETLLTVYEGFMPVHKDLSARIIASTDIPPEMAIEINEALADLEAEKNMAIDAFTQAQEKFLD